MCAPRSGHLHPAQERFHRCGWHHRAEARTRQAAGGHPHKKTTQPLPTLPTASASLAYIAAHVLKYLGPPPAAPAPLRVFRQHVSAPVHVHRRRESFTEEHNSTRRTTSREQDPCAAPADLPSFQALQEGGASTEPAAGAAPAGTGKEFIKSVTEAVTDEPTADNAHYVKGYTDKVLNTKRHQPPCTEHITSGTKNYQSLTPSHKIRTYCDQHSDLSSQSVHLLVILVLLIVPGSIWMFWRTQKRLNERGDSHALFDTDKVQEQWAKGMGDFGEKLGEVLRILHIFSHSSGPKL